MQVLGRIFQDLWILLPHWAVGLLAAVTAIALVPGWSFRRRTTRIREAVRQMVRAEPAQVVKLEERLWGLAGEHPDLLSSAVREARRREIPKVANEAMRRLEALPGSAKLVDQLKSEVTREAQHQGDVLATVLRIETMLSDDRLDAARAALDDAIQKWPDDPHLTRLRPALDAALAPKASDGSAS